jgi:hypothetical protein
MNEKTVKDTILKLDHEIEENQIQNTHSGLL